MEEQGDKALNLLQSEKGAYIIGQALDIAIQAMETVPEPHKEVSNIKDMKLLRSELFPIAWMSRMATENAGYSKFRIVYNGDEAQ